MPLFNKNDLGKRRNDNRKIADIQNREKMGQQGSFKVIKSYTRTRKQCLFGSKCDQDPSKENQSLEHT